MLYERCIIDTVDLGKHREIMDPIYRETENVQHIDHVMPSLDI